MSEDVEKAMIEVIYAHSGKSAPESEAYWNDLKESGIYKADVYWSSIFEKKQTELVTILLTYTGINIFKKKNPCQII